MKPTIDLGVLHTKLKKEIIYLEEMREGLAIITNDMIIIGTGENKKGQSVGADHPGATLRASQNFA